MNTYIYKDLNILAVPNNIEDITTFNVEEINEDTIKLTTNDPITISKHEKLEFFANVKDGILYFQSEIENVNENSIEISLIQEYELLQRRENKRVLVNIPINIIEDDKTFIPSMLIDLSVGGIKVETKNQLTINKEYRIILDFDKLNMDFKFIPTRLSFDDERYYTSGKIILSTPSDKIELVQYCYKKIFEQTNR